MALAWARKLWSTRADSGKTEPPSKEQQEASDRRCTSNEQAELSDRRCTPEISGAATNNGAAEPEVDLLMQQQSTSSTLSPLSTLVKKKLILDESPAETLHYTAAADAAAPSAGGLEEQEKFSPLSDDLLRAKFAALHQTHMAFMTQLDEFVGVITAKPYAEKPAIKLLADQGAALLHEHTDRWENLHKAWMSANSQRQSNVHKRGHTLCGPVSPPQEPRAVMLLPQSAHQTLSAKETPLNAIRPRRRSSLPLLNPKAFEAMRSFQSRPSGVVTLSPLQLVRSRSTQVPENKCSRFKATVKVIIQINREKKKVKRQEPREPSCTRFLEYFAAFSIAPKRTTDLSKEISESDVDTESRRLPKQNYADSPMPDNIPAFAFSVGPLFLSAKKNCRQKPETPIFFTLVLTDANGHRMYVSCCHYYKLHESKQWWFARCLCLISRHAFITTMKHCLLELCRMEGKPFDSNPEKVLTLLLYDIPLPVPGGPWVQFNIGQTRFECAIPSSVEFPLLDFPLERLFRYLSIDIIVEVFTTILTEQRVLFHSKYYSLLTIVAESFFSLIFPFQWSHTYIPVLPEQLLDIVDAPVPFVLGVHTSSLEKLSLQALEGVLLVDIENGKLSKGAHVIKVALPSKESAELRQSLRLILAKKARSEKRESKSTPSRVIQTYGAAAEIKFVAAVRQAFFDVFRSLLRDYTKCLFFLGDGVPIFNVDSFFQIFGARGEIEGDDDEAQDDSFKAIIQEAKALKDKRRREADNDSFKSAETDAGLTTKFLDLFLSSQMFGWFLESSSHPTIFHNAINGSLGGQNILRKPRCTELFALEPAPICQTPTKRHPKGVRSSDPPMPSSRPQSRSNIESKVCDWMIEGPAPSLRLDIRQQYWNVARRASPEPQQPPVTKLPPRSSKLVSAEEDQLKVYLRTLLTSGSTGTGLGLPAKNEHIPSVSEAASVQDVEHAKCLESLQLQGVRDMFSQLVKQPQFAQKKVRLDAPSFGKLQSLVARSLDICLQDKDYRNAKTILDISECYYRFGEGILSPGGTTSHFFLEHGIRNHRIWRELQLWETVYLLELERAMDIEKTKEMEGKPTRDRAPSNTNERLHYVLVGRLGKLLKKMLDFGQPREVVCEFVARKASEAGLVEEDRKMLLLLATNVELANADQDLELRGSAELGMAIAQGEVAQADPQT